MQLEGSCHCTAVTFTVESHTPYPYQRCYCSICRKTQGGGGYAINLSADARSLKLSGSENIAIYRAKVQDDESGERRTSTAERHFCKYCGSGLWLFSPEWPELIHPFASAIDTHLPRPALHTHLFVDFKATWVALDTHPNDKLFKGCPDESIAQWHERMGDEC